MQTRHWVRPFCGAHDPGSQRRHVAASTLQHSAQQAHDTAHGTAHTRRTKTKMPARVFMRARHSVHRKDENEGASACVHARLIESPIAACASTIIPCAGMRLPRVHCWSWRQG